MIASRITIAGLPQAQVFASFSLAWVPVVLIAATGLSIAWAQRASLGRGEAAEARMPESGRSRRQLGADVVEKVVVAAGMKS